MAGGEGSIAITQLAKVLHFLHIHYESSAILVKGSAAAVFAKELFICGQAFHTENKRWKAYLCRLFGSKIHIPSKSQGDGVVLKRGRVSEPLPLRGALFWLCHDHFIMRHLITIIFILEQKFIKCQDNSVRVFKPK